MSTVPTPKAQVRVHIRWMIRRDMPEVLDIEAMSFPTPWDADEFIAVLHGRNCIGQIVEFGDGPGDYPVVGYMIYELCERRLRLLNLAVHPAWRRRGVGLAMIAKLKGKLSGSRRNRITLDLHERNLEAALFFRDMGFQCEKLRRGFFDNGDDALRMVFRMETM